MHSLQLKSIPNWRCNQLQEMTDIDNVISKNADDLPWENTLQWTEEYVLPETLKSDVKDRGFITKKLTDQHVKSYFAVSVYVLRQSDEVAVATHTSREYTITQSKSRIVTEKHESTFSNTISVRKGLVRKLIMLRDI